jgi:chromosome segregation ATPase
MLSEQEMKDFFQRIIDQVATLSTQAARVEGLIEHVNRLTERLESLENDNSNLRNEVRAATDKANTIEGMLVNTQNMLDNERAVTVALRETIVQRDAGVVQLEQSFRSEQDAHKITVSERDDARRKVEELQTEVEHFRGKSEDLARERDEWRNKVSELESTNASLKQQLDKIKAVVSPLYAVQDVA